MPPPRRPGSSSRGSERGAQADGSEIRDSCQIRLSRRKDKPSRPDLETLRLLRDIVDEIRTNSAIVAGGTTFKLTIESAPVPGFTVEEPALPALPVLRHLLKRLPQLDMPTNDVRLARVVEILDRVGVKPDWQESPGIARAAYVTAQQVNNMKVQDPDEPPVTDPTHSPTWIRPREAFGLWAYGGVIHNDYAKEQRWEKLGPLAQGPVRDMAHVLRDDVDRPGRIHGPAPAARSGCRALLDGLLGLPPGSAPGSRLGRMTRRSRTACLSVMG